MARIQQLTMAQSNRGLLFLALGAGLVAAVLAFVVLSSSGSDSDGGTVAGGTTVKAVVASQSISPGTKITADMLQVVEVPKDLLVAGSYGDSQLVVGQTTSVAVATGEQLTPQKLGSFVRDLDALSGVVPAGKRAVAISVNQVTAVGGLLLPGDRVDIVVTYKVWHEGMSEEQSILRTRTILQDVEVLSVAQEAQTPAAQPTDGTAAGTTTYTSGQLPEDVEEQPDAATVTVALDPAQIQELAAKQQHALKVWAVLRGYGDNAVAGVASHDLLVNESKDGAVVED